jgi:hypothetical protein
MNHVFNLFVIYSIRWQVCTLSIPQGALSNGSSLCAVNHIFSSGKKRVCIPILGTLAYPRAADHLTVLTPQFRYIRYSRLSLSNSKS